jgi:hypothetical protein
LLERDDVEIEEVCQITASHAVHIGLQHMAPHLEDTAPAPALQHSNTESWRGKERLSGLCLWFVTIILHVCALSPISYLFKRRKVYGRDETKFSYQERKLFIAFICHLQLLNVLIEYSSIGEFSYSISFTCW